MRASFALEGPLFAILLVFAAFLQACSGPWLRVRQVPEDGYKQTLNYQFQAQVHSDSLGECKMMVVRVKALNKFYTKGAPPPRLQLFDDDLGLRAFAIEPDHEIRLQLSSPTFFSTSEYVNTSLH